LSSSLATVFGSGQLTPCLMHCSFRNLPLTAVHPTEPAKPPSYTRTSQRPTANRAPKNGTRPMGRQRVVGWSGFQARLRVSSDSRSPGSLSPSFSSSPATIDTRLNGGVQSTTISRPPAPSGWYVKIYEPVICRGAAKRPSRKHSADVERAGGSKRSRAAHERARACACALVRACVGSVRSWPSPR
jgi:hypothetical protein